MMYLALTGGLILLLLCGDLLVRGSVALATRMGIPSIVTGLTVVAFGTSAPELVVCVEAALSGAPGMALGNVVGSNIANILMVLGLPALIYPTLCAQPAIRRNAFLMIGATLVFLLFASTGVLSFWQGFSLVSLLALFLIYSGYYAVTHPQQAEDPGDLTEFDGLGELQRSRRRMALFIGAGVVGLPLGAHLVVIGGTDIAVAFGISDAAIGLTLIAIGTSLPELATTVMAALRRQSGVAVGNVIGSNIFNILGILGVTALVAPLPVPESFLRFDMWVMLIAALVILPVILARGTITRSAGAGFVLAYGAYIYFALRADQAVAAATGL